MLSVNRHSNFASVRDQWESLLAHAAVVYPFQLWQWQNLWWETFGDGADLWLLDVRDGDAVIGLAPFMARDGRLSFVGGRDVCDYLDILAVRGREEAVARAVLDYLSTAEWQSVEMQCVLPSGVVWQHLRPLVSGKDLTADPSPLDVSPSLPLPGDWETYVSSLSKRDRHELRRKIRRLEAEGETRDYALVGDEIDEQAVSDFLTLHRLSTPEKARFMDEKMEGFFRSIFSTFRNGLLRLYFLEVHGRRVSSALCFDCNDDLLLYNSGYDPEYSRLSVGLLLKAFCIRDAIALGRRRFDFLRGDERYKYDLGGQDVPVYSLSLERRRLD